MSFSLVSICFDHSRAIRVFSIFSIQSNLRITTTLGTGKKWSLFGGGRYSEGQTVKLIFLIKKFHENRGWGLLYATLYHRSEA